MATQDVINSYLGIIREELALLGNNENQTNASPTSIPENEHVSRLQQHILSNENELALLRAKNATKNGVINRLRLMINNSNVEKQAMQKDIQNLQAEIVINKCMMAAKIKELERDLDSALQEIDELKCSSPRSSRGARSPRPKLKSHVSSSSLGPVAGADKENVQQYPKDCSDNGPALNENDKKKARKGRPLGSKNVIKSYSDATNNDTPYWSVDTCGLSNEDSLSASKQSGSIDAAVLSNDPNLETTSSLDEFKSAESQSTETLFAHSFLSADMTTSTRHESTTTHSTKRRYASDPTGGGVTNNRKKGRPSLNVADVDDLHLSSEKDTEDVVFKEEEVDTSSDIRHTTRPSNRTKPVNYFPKDMPLKELNKPTVRRSSTGSISGSVDEALVLAPKNLTEHCQAIVQAKNQQSVLTALDFIMKRFRSGNTLASVRKLFELNIPEALIGILSTATNNSLIHLSMRVLNNIIARSTPQQFHRVMRMNFVPRLVAFIDSSAFGGIVEETIWILNNIVLDGGSYRKLALDSGALHAVLKVLRKQPSVQVKVHSARFLATVTAKSAFKHADHLSEIRSILQALSSLLQDMSSPDIILSSCCAIANLTEDEDADIVAEVFTVNEIPKCLINALSNTKSDTQFFAVDALGHLATGTEVTTVSLVELQLLPTLRTLMSSKVPSVAASACRCLSNICGCSEMVIQAVMDAELFPLALDLMEHSADPNVRLYLSYAIMFAFHGASLQQTLVLVDAGAIPMVVGLLHAAETPETTGVIMEALTCIDTVLYKMENVTDFDRIVSMVENANGWTRVERLRESDNAEIKEMAINLDCDSMRDTAFAVTDSNALCNTEHVIDGVVMEENDNSESNANEQVDLNEKIDEVSTHTSDH